MTSTEITALRRLIDAAIDRRLAELDGDVAMEADARIRADRADRAQDALATTPDGREA